jgi:prepilin-type N-terminal cleavage/methylation domain-containing protein
MKNTKKKALTLIEIMIVIALIGIIGGVVGVNMKKSLKSAKDFKAKMHMQKINEVLQLELAQSSDGPDAVIKRAKRVCEDSGLFKDTKNIFTDADGKPFSIKFENDEFTKE